MSKRSSGGGWVFAVIALVLIAIAAWFLVQRARKADAAKPAPVPAATTPAPAPASTAPAIAHPIEQAQTAPAAASTAPLPALGDSDASVLAGLSALVPGSDIGAWLVHQSIIPRIVATVDALPRQDLSPFILPVHPAK
ncbi:MAG: hypothetical protein B7X33_01300, partial [Lysobacterales bacterium 13-68-4]